MLKYCLFSFQGSSQPSFDLDPQSLRIVAVVDRLRFKRHSLSITKIFIKSLSDISNVRLVDVFLHKI